MANQVDNDVKVIGNENIYGWGQQHILSISTGTRLYTSFINESNEVEVQYSADGGGTWTPDTSFAETSPYFISMCRSELDDIFVSYVANATGTRTMKVKKRDHTSGAWSEVLSGTQGGTYPPHPLITYNRVLNRLHYFWLYDTGVYVFIENKYSDNYGSTWTSGTLRTQHSGLVDHKLYGIDTHPVTGKVYLFLHTTNSLYFVVEKFSPVGVWEIRDQAGPDAITKAGSFVIDSLGNNIIFYSRLQGSNYYLTILKAGVSQSEVVYGSTKTILEGACAVGIDGSNNIYAFYTKTDNKLYYKSTLNGYVEAALTVNNGVRASCEQRSLPASTKLNYIFSSNV